jgi:hypothetical protein
MISAPAMITMLADALPQTRESGFSWRPLIDPVDLHSPVWLGGWTLLIPLALGIAVIYKAVRVPDPPVPSGQGGAAAGRSSPSWWSVYWRQVLVLTVQIVVAMLGLAAAVYLFVEVYVKWIAGHGA